MGWDWMGWDDGIGSDRIDKIYTIDHIDKIGNIYRYR